MWDSTLLAFGDRAALAVGAVATLASAGSVAQAAAPNGCSSGYSVCMYHDDNFKGGGYFANGAGKKGNLTGFNDATNSWYNNSGLDARWF